MNTYQKRAPDCRIRSFSSEKVQYFFSPYLTYADEPDAFPFRGNEVLHGIAQTSVRGNVIYLTATPDAFLEKRVKSGELLCLKLNRRPHGHDLPVPVLRTGPVPYLIVCLLRWLKGHDSPRMVFAPTIREAVWLCRLLSLFGKCFLCTSKTEDRDEVIAAFRKEEAGIMVCTTVMERGVTIPNVDVCVFHADHGVFDEASLVQMAGRAGRTFQYPEGDVLFLLSERSPLVQKCRNELREANRCAV